DVNRTLFFQMIYMRSILLLMVILVGGYYGNAQTTTPAENCFELPVSLVKNNGDSLTITCKCDLSEFNFQLFNRWGSLLYESKKFGKSLDLNMNESEKGQAKFPSGTYFWKIDYRKVSEKEKSSETGFINVL
ncbi:MAG: gliding motility-associated C-terminal domain-containing protein, partial [Flavobacteriia bacterium]